MIKLFSRESMKNVSRIFSAIVCSASLFAFRAYGAVATTSGSNLTAYNPSTAYNNQWASMSNPRNDNVSAKADFGNCNAIVLRCAQPKCANGGCGEMNVAAGIVAGCVKSNDKCKQYGDDLVNYMTAQLVASSQAKINASNAEQIQAAQDAAQQAQMAAQQAAAQSAQQMAKMQSNMQQQMMQMQQQMAEQNAQSAQAIADALAASQQQQQQAISDMRSAAESAAHMQASGNVITAQDEAAIARGVSGDVLEREKISGQIMTELEGAKTSLKEVKVALDKAFIEYAGCDSRGDNCSGPKRVKKWRELAAAFIEPYDNVVAKISDALDVAQVVGVDLSDIYMMLNNSCNSWGQYLCPVGTVEYDNSTFEDGKGQKGTPKVCKKSNSISVDYAAQRKCIDDISADDRNNEAVFKAKMELCREQTKKQNDERDCQYCTLIKMFSSKDTEEIYQSWINTEVSSTENQVIVACASNAINKNSLLARHAKRKSGTGVLDLDILDEWINTYESSAAKENKYKNENNLDKEYCSNGTEKSDFVKALNSKVIDENKLCSGYNKEEGYCGQINSDYAICDIHAWNADVETPLNNTNDIEKVREVIGKKVTLIAQQAYKQYEYLSATLRRLETSLKKSVLSAQLEKAGAESGGSSGGINVSGNGGNSKNSQYADCAGKTRDETMYCLRGNYSALANKVKNKQCGKAEKRQMQDDAKVLESLVNGQKVGGNEYSFTLSDCETVVGNDGCDKCLRIYNAGILRLQDLIDDREAQRRGGYRN